MKKIYPNAQCPCGSGLKYKKCRCQEFHPTKRQSENTRVKSIHELGLPQEVNDSFLKMGECAKKLYKMENGSISKIGIHLIKSNDVIVISNIDGSRKSTVFSSGLIEKYISLVKIRYPDYLIEKYFPESSADDIRTLICDLILRKTTLHEYYHWLRGHNYWGGEHNALPPEGTITESQQRQYNLNQQAIEYDADRYAISMLLRMLSDEKKLSEETILCILLAFATITFRSNYEQSSGHGYDFGNYKERLTLSHPLPAVRYYYFQKYLIGKIKEEYDMVASENITANLAITAYDFEKEITEELQKQGNFMDVAHTEVALNWQRRVVLQLDALLGEISEFCEVDYLGRPENWEYNYNKEDIWFDENGFLIKH